MARIWTEEQKAAFSLDNRNILVAAAAGSGKTAVLVQRIIEKITNEAHPVNVDELVVVTFTKAAAAEMKQRIREAIDGLVEENPENMHLVRQLTLLNQAQITTIDSFCLNVVRNHFTEVDLDPCFRTADEGEIKLLEDDLMKEMLEEYYASNREDFYELVDSYGAGRDDANMEDMIYKLYRFARSNPWPDQWYAMCLQPYQNAKAEEWNALQYIYENIKHVLRDYEQLYCRLWQMCQEPQGPVMYAPAIESDLASIRQLLAADSFSELGRRVGLVADSFEDLGRKAPKDVDAEKKEYVKKERNGYKDYIGSLVKKVFIAGAEELLADLQYAHKSVAMFIELAKDFSNRMAQEKRQRNIIDFNDMEHLALDILVSVQDGKKTYTEVARTMAAKYHEIMIDEYQDSNLLQEEILRAVSKSAYEDQPNNIYMVGDVKQSIYRFRLACPELFIEKYNGYAALQNGDASNQKIELQMNFRSRENVLESVNDVFRRVMQKGFCGIAYDTAARLNTGLDYGRQTEESNETEGKQDFGQQERKATELVLIETPEKAKQEAKEVEAQYVAKRIEALMEESLVFDPKTQEYRKLRYSDIVILTRSVKGTADKFVNVLLDVGIPAYFESTGGYFATYEIKVLMNYLSVIDNPTKDIAMTGVLLSYFGGFTTEELAKIRLLKQGSLYGQLLTAKDLAAEATENTELYRKVQTFVERLEVFRKKSEYMSIQELVWLVVYDTGYYDYVGTMPSGKQRQANVDLLLQRASSYERTSYSGLFNFLRYVERMKKSEVDSGEASVLGENEDLVRVMSIHKSKGLEFPVVFLVGMDKKINIKDASRNILIDQDLGIGMDVIRLNQRTKRKTILKSAISKKIVQETIAEEQRVLYVAMTRAREKLIMTGTTKNLDKERAEWERKAGQLLEQDAFTYLDNEGFGNYFDMVMPVALLPAERNMGRFQIEEIKTENLETAETLEEKMLEEAVNEEMLEEQEEQQGAEPSEQVAFAPCSTYPDYGYEMETNKKLKITVSELKQMQHDADIDENELLSPDLRNALSLAEHEEEGHIPVPKFIAGEAEVLAGNARGTAYHRVMECLDYNHVGTVEEIAQSIEGMVEEARMTRIQADSVAVTDIKTFCDSQIGQRIGAAMAQGNVRREQPFVFRPKNMLDQNGKQLDQLVQGVIDLYLEEGDGLVIVDYKTDRVKKGKAGEAQLTERYRIQLDYYAKALEQITGKPVKEKVIYSFALGYGFGV